MRQVPASPHPTIRGSIGIRPRNGTDISCGESFASSLPEQIGVDATLRANVAAHIFEHTRDGQIGFLTEVEAPPHIRHGQVPEGVVTTTAAAGRPIN